MLLKQLAIHLLSSGIAAHRNPVNRGKVMSNSKSTKDNSHHQADTRRVTSELDIGFLPLGSTFRQPLEHYEAPCDVCSASDLPSRLYLGSLNPDSFHATDTGWSVHYEDAASTTFVTLEYSASEGMLSARFVWEGIEGIVTYTPGKDWKRLLQYMSVGGIPDEWEERTKELIEPAFNARLIPHKKDAHVISGFPDGPLKSLIFPVPSYRLHDLFGCLDDIERDPDIASVVAAYVTMTQSKIEYMKEFCPDVPDDPEILARQSRHAVGLSCEGLPRFQKLENNLHLITLNRWVYITHINCAFRDIKRVMSHFQKHGFIGTPNSASSSLDYPDGVEWTALVLPGNEDAMGANIQYFDDEKTRRVAYGSLLPPGSLPRIATVRDISRKVAMEQALAIEEWAISMPDVIQPDTPTTTA